MTRNIKSKLDRTAARLGFMKNMLDVGDWPERHLMMTLSIMEQVQAREGVPPFETGLMMGAMLAVCCGDMRGATVVRKILNDISAQQDDLDEVEPTPEPAETSEGDESGALVEEETYEPNEELETPTRGDIESGAL
jgi:hypothetical protein